MNSGFSGLSYTQIVQIANELKAKGSAMQSLLARIESELKKVGNDGTWSGTAAAASFEEFNKLMKKFPEFYEAINSCATHLNNVVSTYKAVDTTIMGK